MRARKSDTGVRGDDIVLCNNIRWNFEVGAGGGGGGTGILVGCEMNRGKGEGKGMDALRPDNVCTHSTAGDDVRMSRERGGTKTRVGEVYAACPPLSQGRVPFVCHFDVPKNGKTNKRKILLYRRLIKSYDDRNSVEPVSRPYPNIIIIELFS